MHHIELIRCTTFLAKRQNLHPSQTFDFIDDHAKVLPINSGKGILNINFKTLQLRFLHIIFLHFLLLECAHSSWSWFSLDSLPQRIVLVYYQVFVLSLQLWVNLEEKKLPFHLRVWVSNQDEVVIKLLNSIQFEHF